MKTLIKSTIFQIFVTFFLFVGVLSLTTRVNESYGVIEGSIDILIAVMVSTLFYAKFLAKYDAGKKIYSHGPRLAFRFVLLTFVPAMMWLQSGEINNLLLAIFAYTEFYILFELYLNKYNHNPPFYVGEVANSDKLVHKINSNPFFSRNFPIWFITWKMVLYMITIMLVLCLWL